MSCAIGQRGWKAQPAGMFSGLGGPPRSSACDLRFVRSISEMWRSAPGYRYPSGYPALRLAAPLRRCGQDTSPPRGRSHAAPPTGHPSPLPREHRNPHAARNLLRARSDNLARRRTDQIRHHQDQMLATPRQSRIKSNQDAPIPLFNDAPNCLRISDVGTL